MTTNSMETPKHFSRARMDRKRIAYLAILPLAALYFLACKLGFTMAFAAEQVTAVWPATGIALAFVLIFGFRVWPGIAIGAFLANYGAHETALTAVSITFGNTMEALAGAWMLRRVGFDSGLSRLRDVLALFTFSAVFSTMISATIGVATLCASGLQPWNFAPHLWTVWWIGDATGALMVAPAILVFAAKNDRIWRTTDVLEALILLAGLALTCAGIFTATHISGIDAGSFVYLVFPFVVWAALRFGPRMTTLVSLSASAIAIFATMQHSGPFPGSSVHSLDMLQIFMGAVTCTGLLLSAALSENLQKERSLMAVNRRKDEFLAMLAHELRNPLAPALSALSVMREPSTPPQQYAESLDIMERQLAQMARLVNDLVDASRMSHGKIQLKRELLTAQDAIARSIEASKPLMEASGHTLSVRLPRDPLWLDADAGRLAQVFTNLLNNAAKYTPRGGHVLVELKHAGNDAVIAVRDTGIGIPPAMLPRVFDLFMQVDDSLARSNGGLGIGLTLVKNLVEMHGGRVGARSAGVGRGSEFSVTLPLTAAPATPAVQPPRVEATPEAAPPKQGLKVVIADDNHELAKTLGWTLEHLGHRVALAHDGESALELCQAERPDAVLLDIGLPGMNGYEVCKKLRSLPEFRNCRIIAQTGWSQPEHQERSKAAGFDHHLIKPVSMKMLESVLSGFSTTKAA